MKDIDWSKAPEWADSVWKGPMTGFMYWVNSVSGESQRMHDGFVGAIFCSRGWSKICDRPAPKWPGEGLPPAGAVCEYYWAAGDSWREGTCVAHFNGRAVICDADDEDCAERLDAHHVRPIRTPEQIAAEKRERELADMREIVKQAHYALLNTEISPSEKAAAYVVALYDAGYRKQ